ncbi:hypothetical protein [Methylosinus sporium]|uniref:hypothetical protein n=1 Tax=Methylosinus sporium TaxID=428 RepID=UPI00157FD1EF|nr:hypothetical protein [Methylosinus sporium]
MEAISISPLSLFMQAGFVGKFVMIALGVASLWGWAVNLDDKSAIDAVDVVERKVVASYALPNCEAPTGLACLKGRA